MGLFYCGGGERTVLNEAIGLQKRGHDVTLFCPSVQYDCYPELLKDVDVREIFWWVPRVIPLRDASCMVLTAVFSPLLHRIFRKFDVILAHSQPSNWLAFQIKKRLGIPYIGYLHQTNRFIYPRAIDLASGWSIDPNMEFLRKIHKLSGFIPCLDTISIDNADKILVNSEWIKNRVLDCYNLEAEVCYPGVDITRFSEDANSRETNTPYIISTNRHYPQKWLHKLLDILSLVTSKYPGFRCVLTGSHNKHTTQLMEYARRLKVSESVVFTEQVSEKDLVDLYRRAYVFTYTSPEEDFGLGPLEAGACGVPSIVWDHAGPKETVIEGETGFRVRPYDVLEMAEKHINLLDDPELRHKMGHQAASHVKEMFTWTNHIDIIEKTLDR